MSSALDPLVSYLEQDDQSFFLGWKSYNIWDPLRNCEFCFSCLSLSQTVVSDGFVGVFFLHSHFLLLKCLYTTGLEVIISNMENPPPLTENDIEIPLPLNSNI
jgi:hypothetical protein